MCLMNELTMAVPESTMPSLTTKAFCKVWTYASACANPDWSWKNGTKYPAIGVMTIIFPTWMQYFKPIPLHKVRFGSFQFTFDFGCSIIIAKAIFFLAKLASLSSIFSILQGTLSQWIWQAEKFIGRNICHYGWNPLLLLVLPVEDVQGPYLAEVVWTLLYRLNRFRKFVKV